MGDRIDGKDAAEKVYSSLRARIAGLREQGVIPGLAVIVAGDNPASLTYVRSKARMCEKLGLHSVKKELPAETSQSAILSLIERFNRDPAIHGILVQSPPPPHIDERAIVREIAPHKDVDGFHPVNVAKLAMGEDDGFVPCTPLGCQHLLTHSGIPLRGAHVVVVGRSLIVGKSLALLLMRKGPGGDATVTVAHSATGDLAEVTRRADIVVAAIGRPQALGPDHIGDGAVVIDVGINRVPDPSTPSGTRLVGDVDYDAVVSKCHAITPVPGGVGPMTIAMLMTNTVTAAERTVAQG